VGRNLGSKRFADTGLDDAVTCGGKPKAIMATHHLTNPSIGRYCSAMQSSFCVPYTITQLHAVSDEAFNIAARRQREIQK
jgi:hypothetical protein